MSSVTIERELPHPPDKVWRALTQGALLAEWLMASDLVAEVGRRFTFRAPPMPHWDGIVEGEILDVEPGRLLAYSWTTNDTEAAPGLRTVVTWTIEPIPAGTRLRLEQTGFGPEQRNNLEGARYGWERNLTKLAELLEQSR